LYELTGQPTAARDSWVGAVCMARAASLRGLAGRGYRSARTNRHASRSTGHRDRSAPYARGSARSSSRISVAARAVSETARSAVMPTPSPVVRTTSPKVTAPCTTCSHARRRHDSSWTTCCRSPGTIAAGGCRARCTRPHAACDRRQSVGRAALSSSLLYGGVSSPSSV